jgi:hypothetical protein
MFQHFGTVAVAAAIALTGTAAASASPRAAGAAAATEHVQIMSTSTKSAPQVVIASGVFTAAGHARLGSAAVGKLVFPGGTIKVSHKPAKSSQHFNPATCLSSISQSGTYKLLSGTRRYAGLRGHGTYRLSVLIVAARVHGTCSSAKPPVAEQELLELTGPAHL